MFRTQLVRLGSVVASALLAVMLLGVGGATAATPGWQMTVTPVPSSVTPGSYAAYKAVISNTGKSNISQLYLTDSQSGAPFSVTPSTGCTPNAALFCSIGPLNSGKTKTLVIVYQTPATPGSLSITFQLNTSGSTFSDKGGTSHGDTKSVTTSTTLDASGDFAGGYVVVDGTSFSTATGDVQSTTVNSPATNIPVTITETSGGSSECGSGTVIGQLANLNVNGGSTFSTFFETTLTIQASSLPGELQLGQVSVCHLYDNAPSGTLLPKCAADAAQATACFWPKWAGAHHPDREEHVGEVDADDWQYLVLDVFDNQNGGVRGQFG